jgi:heme-degrading monooxygenase HmoA
MASKGQPFTSGRWVVKAGDEDEFIERWTAFTEWSLENVAGAEDFALIQDAGDSTRFLSFGAWKDTDSVQGWRNSPEFGERLGHCRELCDDFEARDYVLVSAAGRAGA